MGYRHYGEIGDIWKHLPFCELLRLEAPLTHVETNSAFFDYHLDDSPEKAYGIGHFLQQGAYLKAINQSAYVELLSPYFQTNRYLGSCGQAMKLLGTFVNQYVFFDLDQEAIESQKEGANSFG